MEPSPPSPKLTFAEYWKFGVGTVIVGVWAFLLIRDKQVPFLVHLGMLTVAGFLFGSPAAIIREILRRNGGK